jgi:thiamine biosynthesis lipoprotein
VTWPALGTTAVLCAPAGGLDAARAAVEAELEAIDRAASRFREDSELAVLQRAAGRRTTVSALLHEALALAVRAAALTDGAVDPTLGGELAALGYDRDFSRLSAVAADVALERGAALPQPRPAGDWRSIELWGDPRAARLAPGTRLDLGATAKALAADRAARTGAQAAAGPVLVSLGGDIATAGGAPAGGWTVHVTDDHRHPDGEGQTITIASGAVATSSLLARRWYQAGRPVHHVLDPATGAPVDPRWRTVTVAAATCADANVATTAALVLGARAPAWLADRGLPARLVAGDGTVTALGGWPR